MHRHISVSRSALLVAVGLVFFGIYGILIGRTNVQLKSKSFGNAPPPIDEIIAVHLLTLPVVLLISIIVGYVLAALAIGLRPFLGPLRGVGIGNVGDSGKTVAMVAIGSKLTVFLSGFLWTASAGIGFVLGETSLPSDGRALIERDLLHNLGLAVLLGLLVAAVSTLTASIVELIRKSQPSSKR